MEASPAARQPLPSARAVAKIILVAAAVLGVLYFLFLIRQVIGAFVIALFLAVALGPAVGFFERRRLPRALAILVVYVFMLLTVFGIGLLVVPPVVNEINNFVGDVPGKVAELRENDTIREYDEKYGIVEKLKEQADSLPQRLGDAAGALQAVTVGVFSAVIQLVTILVMAFFLLLDGKRIMRWGVRELGDRGPRARRIAGEIYRSVGGYVLGNLAISLVAGVTTYLVLTILGVPFAVPLAVLMAFFDLLPLVGSAIAGVLIALAVSAFGDMPGDLIVWIVFLLIYQQVENNVIQPIVYRKTIALHPLLVIVAVLVGASLLGVLGALLAIPIAGIVQILVKDWWQGRRGKAQREQAPPPAVPPPGTAGAPAPAG